VNWEKISNTIGILLVLICFVFALGRIISLRMRESADNPNQQQTLRIAHFQLEAGVREAIDEIAKRYMEKHPNVRVVQIPIPERIFKNWRITQLVGGTPPDLIVSGQGLTDENLARYYLPLGELANRPNPYNKGTPFENTPLRETYFDGMEGGFNSVLMDFYSVPATTGTFRMFYNLDLVKEITGDTKIPQSYQEFIELCEKTQEFAKRTGRKIAPVGGSKFNANILMDFMFASQTQRMLQEKINRPGQLSILASPTMVARAYLRDEWSLDSPEVHSGLELIRNLVAQLPPGFSQMERDDGTFHFAQGGAVMVPTGSWDATSLRIFSPFPLGVGKLPVPDQTDPEYGKFAYGVISEAGATSGFNLGIAKGGKVELAEDFLQFMSSQAMNKVWTDVSLWPPAVLGVEPAEEARPFMPTPGGYPPGFGISVMGADSTRLYQNNLFRLTGADGSVDSFLEELKPAYISALVSDMKRSERENRNNTRRADSAAAAVAIQALHDPARNQKLDLLIQSRVTSEKTVHQISNTLLYQP